MKANSTISNGNGMLRTLRLAVRYAPVLLSGRPLHDHRRYNPFFIIGAGRSGTTLLRAVLQTEPTVHVPPETYVLGNLIREYRAYSRLPWDAVIRLALSRLEYADHFDTHGLSLRQLYYDLRRERRDELNLALILHRFYMYSAAVHKPGAVRWGDKTPLNTNYLREIDAVFPDARYVHLIRDGRDVIRSLVTMKIFDVKGAAELWRKRVQLARAHRAAHPARVLEVRYEDLATDPDPVLRRVCGFLGIDFNDMMLRHHEIKQDLGDVEKHAYHERVKKPISGGSIGQWRTFFSEVELQQIYAIAGDLLDDADYRDHSTSAVERMVSNSSASHSR